jgi:hypothetical protein
MARIRSIHPGQWTDEDFVCLSPMARLLAIAVRNEADDGGIFEWKETSLKMRLFPADAVEMADLMQELVNARQVEPFEVEGRRYGAIRNFRKYQRPQKPKHVHPLPSGLVGYVGLPAIGQSSTSTLSVRYQSLKPNSEEGGRRDDEGDDEGDMMDDERGVRRGGPGGTSEDIEPNAGCADVTANVWEGDVTSAIAAWNALASEVGLPTVERAPKTRREAVQRRLANCGGLDGWQAGLDKVRESPFLLGEGGRHQRATLDFMLQGNGFESLMRGTYDAGANARRKPPFSVGRKN